VVARAVADAPVVVEAGAGRGSLAAAVRAAGFAGRYVCVERSVALRAAAAERVPDAEVVAELPRGPLEGVVLANELLDDVPFSLLERGPDGWLEVQVGPGPTELLVPAAAEDASLAERLAPDAPIGGRVPLQRGAAAWLRAALAVLRRGQVVAIDYADTTACLARRTWLDWVRTYRAHGRGGHPLEAPGTQDVTCEVAVDQLAALVRPPDRDSSQADWLRAHGLEELVAEARATWHERAHLGDLEALEARSRVGEADALTDPTGLGAFRVLEWHVG
jgi:NADH dehydrogenase [ubiquinone] 1 alpha subcomplex assembly factor 7